METAQGHCGSFAHRYLLLFLLITLDFYSARPLDNVQVSILLQKLEQQLYCPTQSTMLLSYLPRANANGLAGLQFCRERDEGRTLLTSEGTNFSSSRRMFSQPFLQICHSNTNFAKSVNLKKWVVPRCLQLNLALSKSSQPMCLL